MIHICLKCYNLQFNTESSISHFQQEVQDGYVSFRGIES